MDLKDIRKNAYALIYLTSCGINGKTPDMKKLEGYDLGKIYEVGQKHILTAIAAYALESAGIRDERFEQAKGKAIRKNILLDDDRKKILGRLEQENIWYMPLKGSLLKDLYPRSGMRQMADNDILFDSRYRSRVKEIMLGSGFSCEHYDRGNHDVYFRKPVCNFEMHVSLFDENKEIFGEYYKNVKENLHKDEDNRFGYHFSDEDFYIYMLSHEYKHYSAGGTGLRSLLDTYVFLKALGKTLDFDYINTETQKLGISDFEHLNRELANKVFMLKELSEEDKKHLDYYIFSGTYGNIENSVKNKLDKINEKTGKHTKFAYIRNRVFPDMKYITTAVPFVKNNPLLYPAGVVVRLFRAVTTSRKKVRKEYDVLKEINNNDK